MSIKTIEIGERYTFAELEKFLFQDGNHNKALVVNNVEYDCNAIMHVFHENFSDQYTSGDGVLFYSDGETHSSDPSEPFKVINIISF